MIFGVLVHLPEIVKLGISENIFDAQHRGHHGVILIVVLVHAVAANEMEVRITDIKFFTNRGDVARVIVVVNRICFFLPNDASIDHVAFQGKTNLDQLTLSQLD